ncbi:hypothetical protein ACU4I5_26985 (plasmid) [Ensifer adhaerens]
MRNNKVETFKRIKPIVLGQDSRGDWEIKRDYVDDSNAHRHALWSRGGRSKLDVTLTLGSGKISIGKTMTAVEETQGLDAEIVDEPMKAPPSAFCLELLVPMELTEDFIANMSEIYQSQWLPRYGEKRAKLLWRRQCLGLITRHWFDVLVGAAERLRKVFYS